MGIFIVIAIIFFIGGVVHAAHKDKHMTQDERDAQRTKTKEAAKGIASGAVIGTAVVMANLIKDGDKPPE